MPKIASILVIASQKDWPGIPDCYTRVLKQLKAEILLELWFQLTLTYIHTYILYLLT